MRTHDEELLDYLIKIDPYRCSIEAIAFSDSLSYLARQLSARHIHTLAHQPYLDCALFDADALDDQPHPPAWLYRPTGRYYWGTALWVNISLEGQLRTPMMRVDNLLDDIEFVGFIDPVLDQQVIDLSEEERDEDMDTDFDDEVI